MGKTMDSRYRAQLKKEMEAIQAGEVFGTPSYLELMRSIARELTDGRLDSVQLYSFPQEQRMGWCDGRRIGVNYGNNVTESFLTLVQKNISLTGILGHECGHKNYSDFVLRKKYLDGFLEGIWYPYPPEPENEQEEEALEQIEGYLEKREQDALALIVQVAAYLDNLLEDIYVEERMCARFPGSVRQGILLNRGRNVEWIPSLRELQEEGEDPVSILVNLCAQYALSGRINNWDEEQGELLETFQELMPAIEAGCVSEGKSGRFLAVNQVLLKIWKYLYRIIQMVEGEKKEEENKEDSKEGGSDAQENGGKDSGKESEATDEEDGSEQEAFAQQAGQSAAFSQGEEQGEPDEVSPAMQNYLDHLAGRMPKCVQEEHTEKAFGGFPDDVCWSGVRGPEMPKTEDCEKEEQEEAESGQVSSAGEGKQVNTIRVKMVDADSPLQGLLYQIAQERLDEQRSRALNMQLQLEMDSLGFDAGHKQVQKKVCREYQISESQKKQYQQYEEQVKQVQKRLLSAILPILENQGTRTERRLFMGRKLDMWSIADPQGAIYCKSYPGKKLDMAIAVLIDMSGSMMYGRIEPAKLAALCLYEFCRRAKIPVAVYGHHTDGFPHGRLEDEIVYLHSCAEFEPDKNDRYRIAALRPDGANRDGVALRFLGERLLKRPEKQKLFILVSDGLPNSNCYCGELARQDLCAIKKELTGKGITFLAAAIGADKEKIREIYKEAYLDISDVEKLPVMLTKQVLKYIRR